MKTYAIKSILEILALIILYVIAWKHEKRISKGEKVRKEQQEAVREILAPINDLLGLSKEPSFKMKIAGEKKRLNKITRNRPLFPNGYKKRVTK